MNDFVGLHAIGERSQNSLANVREQPFRFAKAPAGAADVNCGNIDNVHNFQRSLRFYDLLSAGHLESGAVTV